VSATWPGQIVVIVIVDYDVMDMPRQMSANIVSMARMMVGTPVFALVAFVPTIVITALPAVVPASIVAAIVAPVPIRVPGTVVITVPPPVAIRVPSAVAITVTAPVAIRVPSAVARCFRRQHDGVGPRRRRRIVFRRGERWCGKDKSARGEYRGGEDANRNHFGHSR
jgi:hypothetical protein